MYSPNAATFANRPIIPSRGNLNISIDEGKIFQFSIEIGFS